MKPLIDGDILRYEVGFYAEYKDEDGNERIRGWEFVEEKLNQLIKEICEGAWGEQPPCIYLTADERMVKRLNKFRAKRDEPLLDWKPNFREGIATLKVYKGNRGDRKRPFYFDAITHYLMDKYECKVAIGMEADDLMSVDQMAAKSGTTIICSRDKDLKMTPGWHYSWQCGKQVAFGPHEYDEIGEIDLTTKGIKGGGLKFFYSQLLTGDGTDNIPGLPRYGPVKSHRILCELESEEDLHNAVKAEYERVYGEDWENQLYEQAHLLWMVRELDENGRPKHFVLWEHR